MWTNFFRTLVKDNDYKVNLPASIEKIRAAEAKLGVEFPQQLTDLYLEMDGDCEFIMSIEQMVNANLTLREIKAFMPLDCLLFFAQNCCGDYIGYAICEDLGIKENDIFFWDHESDNRIWVANDIEQAATRYYTDNLSV